MIRIVGKVLLILFIATSSFAKETTDPIPPNTKLWQLVYSNVYKCTIKKVKDGDTFICDINIPEFSVILVNQDIRVLNYDAPEISHKRQSVEITAEEIEHGKKAREYSNILFKTYDVYVTPSLTKDPYGRFICKVWLSNKEHQYKYLDYSEVMTEQGFSR